MNITNIIKNEILHNKMVISEKSVFELYGMFSTIGQLEIGLGYTEIAFRTESAFIARRIISIIKHIYKILPLIVAKKRGKKVQYFICIMIEKIDGFEAYSYMCKDKKRNIKNSDFDSLFSKKNNRRDFIRGAFLGNGNFINPKVDYHMDITFKTEMASNFAISNLKLFGISAKSIHRGKSYIIYVNRMAEIADFLSLIGANNIMLEYENHTIIKEIRNKANREVNCITANLNKVVKSALEQINSIKYIEDNIGLKQLPNILQETAKIRLAHPEDSLAELTEYFDGLSKSGIRHRLKAICTVANELKDSKKNYNI